MQAPLSLLACLQKFHVEAKMNSSQSSAAAPEEYCALNAQLADMRVKKLLQIADNIRNDETVAITATKAAISSDIAVAVTDLKSQEINLSVGNGTPPTSQSTQQ